METLYEVPRKTWGAVSIDGFGMVSYEIEAGQFVPSTPELAAVCERLAALGMIAAADPKTKTKTKPAPADNDEE